ncbi:TIGR01620 family protein [Aquibium sp. ELW1220]|uniref:YcjF family protein n=1 Tax=Aquibium sp. ELW1220 TaxID=2976766 RepID=UPI0025B05C37|nr:TIGR01620 family protein [Aquibium sp. ELW1220]MDN2581311.1 TIGR01620 family protein [Aquibium sp. ELW1220]
MSDAREPKAFRLPPDRKAAAQAEREPRALHGAEMSVVTPAAVDVFENDTAETAPPPPPAARRRSRLGTIFFGAAGILVSLAIGLSIDELIRSLFARADWLGWLGAGLAAVATAALLAILIREAAALTRLSSVENLSRRAVDALERNDPKAARALVDDLSGFLASRPQTAKGRRTLDELRHDVIDGPDLIRLAETELLAPLDAEARRLILDAGKRVSMVTAVSPRAAVDLVYVLYEASRLIRRLAELYGARPGTLGFLRLARGVLAHLAVTGSMAAGDTLVQQLVGHGLAARLSAKLGEGVVNGMMTVRIGMAAMDTVRPLPFDAVRKPRMGDFVGALARFAGAQDGQKDTPSR